MATEFSNDAARGVPEREYRVTPLELFFDVVFVFGVWQLSHHLLEPSQAFLAF